MVRYDSLKSIRSNKSAHAQSKENKTKKKDKQSKGKDKGKGKDKNSAAELTPSPPTNKQPNTKSAAEAEPEAIQDLEGLRRQQILRLQKAEEKRREYSQGAPDVSSALGTNNSSTANIQPPPPPPPSQSVADGLDTSKEGLGSKNAPNLSSDVNLRELTLRLEQEAKSAPIPQAISLDQMPQSVDMDLTTMSLPLGLGVIAPDALTPSATSKVEENGIDTSGGTAHVPIQAPIQAPIHDAETIDKSTVPIEPPAKEEINGDTVVQANTDITLDPAVQDVVPIKEKESAIVVAEATGKETSAVPIETTVSSARTSLEEEEDDGNENEVPAMELTHMGRPPPEQSMIAV